MSAPDPFKARAELAELTSSMAYAYAMGHSCTNGNHPEYTKIRRRAAELTAIIREHDPQ